MSRTPSALATDNGHAPSDAEARRASAVIAVPIGSTDIAAQRAAMGTAIPLARAGTDVLFLACGSLTQHCRHCHRWPGTSAPILGPRSCRD
jgi:aromatic ring-opening dioxygenase catalytic subunit (LigB family)